jgi:hypothetical protein
MNGSFRPGIIEAGRRNHESKQYSGIRRSLIARGLASAYGGARRQPVAMKIQAPEFEKADEWINSRPLQLKDLRGQVVVVHFWTFG